MNISSTVHNLWMSWTKTSVAVKVISVVVVLGLGYFSYTKLRPAKTTTATLQTASATKGTLIVSVTASGNLTEGNNLNITTNASGVISQVFVKNGDKVKKGQKIAQITFDQDAQQRQTQAWSNYLSAKNQLAAAQAKINSLQAAEFKANQAFINDAVERDLATTDPTYIQEQATWLQAESDYKNQTAVISQAQAALSNAWITYQQTSATITAPMDGIVDHLTIAPGTVITSSSSSSSNNSSTVSSQKVGIITQSQNQAQAVVSLSEMDAATVSVGNKVTMTLDAFPNKTFTGKIVMIDTNGSVSSGVTTYPATIVFDSAEKNMYPNMAVAATIITNVKDNVLLIPSSAITTANGTSTVRVMQNGQTTVTAVEIGEANDTQTEITSGLNEGDVVVTGSAARTTTGSSGSTSVFSSLGGNRGFGAGGGATIRVNRGG